MFNGLFFGHHDGHVVSAVITATSTSQAKKKLAVQVRLGSQQLSGMVAGGCFQGVCTKQQYITVPKNMGVNMGPMFKTHNIQEGTKHKFCTKAPVIHTLKLFGTSGAHRSFLSIARDTPEPRHRYPIKILLGPLLRVGIIVLDLLWFLGFRCCHSAFGITDVHVHVFQMNLGFLHKLGHLIR